MKLFNTIRNAIKYNAKLMKSRYNDCNISFSQWGEDIIVNNIFNNLKYNSITYLDIGANHPIVLNNTWFFYLNNMKGVLVEPDPELCKLLKRYRKKDIVINSGAGQKGNLTLYKFNNHSLNTFSQKEAESNLQKNNNYRIINKVSINILPINSIISENFDSYPNFISIDVEGMEMEILQDFNFETFKTEVFCIETYSWAEDRRVVEIIDFMQKKGYRIYSETGLNTIFIRNF